ncbi:phage baseplate assembly protein V [Vibrio parahaemolyticus]|uniref:phage baseplate assembly protein V n=1 Tax=Vibrio parahaemolyticus TaxID=670 RepID=UPI001FADEB8D|nr:phage baseplate assembly protein V [Vibrio parahaemolyticus]
MDLEERVSELERKLEEVFIRGVILESNSIERWVVVSYGTEESPMQTGKLPVKPIRSGKAIVWWFPEVGEAVTVISPGDLRFGEVFPGSYYSERPAPSDDPDLFLVEFGDGSKVSHHRGTHKLELINMGDVEATIEGNVTGLVKGDVEATVEGNLTGTIKGTTNATFDQDVTAHVKGNATVNCDKAVSVAAKGAIDVQTNQTLTVKSAGAMNLATDASMELKAGGSMKLTASRIDFN